MEETCVGFKIVSVDSREDKIVYTGGITHEDYVSRNEGGMACTLIRMVDTFPSIDLGKLIPPSTIPCTSGDGTTRPDDHGVFPQGQNVSTTPIGMRADRPE